MRRPAGIAGRRLQREAKACVNLLNIVRKRHLQLPTWRWGKKGELGATPWGVGGGDKELQQTAAAHAGHTVTI